MKNIFTISFALIKEKKVQNLLIGLVILFCAALFSSSLGTLLNLDDLFLKVCDNQKVSHIILKFNKKQYNYKEIEKWFKDNQYVESTSLLPYYKIKGDIYKNENKIQQMVDLVECPSEKIDLDLLEIAEGEQKSTPGIREVWVPTAFAYANNIKVGDDITIPAGDRAVTFKVSALVVDPAYSSNYLNPTRMWIAPGEISILVPFSQSDNILFSARYTDYTQMDSVWKEFESYLGSSFGGSKLDFDDYFNLSTMTSKMITNIVFGFSIFITIIMIIIISFMISNSIVSEYKTIGVYKAQGFSNGNIILSYILQYMFLGIIASPIGVIMSKWLINIIMKDFIKAMGIANVNIEIAKPAVITFVIIMSVIFAVVLLTARKVGKVKPIDAIRFGGSYNKNISKKASKTKLLSNVSVNLFICIKEIFSDLKKTVFLCIMIVSMTFMFFSVNSIITSMKITFKDSSALGIEKSDIWIENPDTGQSISNEYLLKKIKNNEYVKNVVPTKILENTSMKINNESENILLTAYKGNMDSLGLVNIEGRHPKNYNEISISKVINEETHKTIGDMIDVTIEGEKSTFLITGIYQSMSGGGKGFRTQFSALEKISPILEANRFVVCLKEGADVQQAKLMLKKDAGAFVNVTLVDDSVNKSVQSLILSISSAMMIISFIIIIVCCISIFNYITLTIHEQKKNYGIYKVIGLSPKQIRWILICRVQIITIAAVIFGFIIMLLGTPKILETILGTMGFSEISFAMNFTSTVLIIPFSMFITAVSAWISSKKVKKLSPRELIIE